MKDMLRKLENPSVFKKAVIVAFLICFSYWIYLIPASQILLRHDAIGYESLGQMIYEKGWIEYFKEGPTREPLYPFSIAISMRVADMFSISYQLVQKIIQVMILFVTQILMLILLNKLKIKNGIKLMTVLYFGFSPAIVNSAFSLFSEIATYPFVLAIILLGTLSWRAIYKSGPRRIAVLSFCTSLSFALAAFSKGIFQYVFLFFLIPYFCIAINSIRKRNKVILSQSILYVVVAILVFNSFIIPFKLMNKRFNGHFEFTDRYDWALFGNAAKRANPLTSRILLAHLVSIPGKGVCRLFFSENECQYCEFSAADGYIPVFYNLLADTPKDKVKSKVLSLVFEKIMKNPLQYVLFMGIEALRMPFWESTQIGFVDYPSWLRRLYAFKLFKNGLRLLVAMVTFFSLFYMTAVVYKNRRRLFDSQLDESESPIICFFVFLLIFSYTGLYSLFSILTRYALPIAPLYLICIAYFVHNKVYKK